MTSVAYSAPPSLPGWLRTAWLLALGWVASAGALGAIYVLATLAGVFGAGSGGWHRGVLNEWPFPANGTWSFCADVSALALTLLVVSVVTAHVLRASYTSVSEPRLAVVFLVTGIVPLASPHHRPGVAIFLFAAAVFLVRRWASKVELRPRPRRVAATAVALALLPASYGLTHPVWLDSAEAVMFPVPGSGGKTILLTLHNVSRLPVTLERLDGGPLASAGAGFPPQVRPTQPVRVAPGASGVFTVRLRPVQGCATFLPDVRVRYRIAGVTMEEPLRVPAVGLPRCS